MAPFVGFFHGGVLSARAGRRNDCVSILTKAFSFQFFAPGSLHYRGDRSQKCNAVWASALSVGGFSS